jgi:predicted phosphodiesterase
MRYAIISDVHANLQAWHAVQADMALEGVQAVISLGDLVGYGPNPREVFTEAFPAVDYHLLGNHDAAVCGKVRFDHWNPMAREIISWTRAQLDDYMIEAFRHLSLSLTDGRFRCTHGEFSSPGTFYYVTRPAQAMRSWNAVPEQLLFVGHCHAPALFVLGSSGTPHRVPPQAFVLEEGKRYLVNVGSVGSPRHDDLQASYTVYDTATQTVRWRRVPFDLQAYRDAVKAAKLPCDPSVSLWEEIESAAGPQGVLRVRQPPLRIPIAGPGGDADRTEDG